MTTLTVYDFEKLFEIETLAQAATPGPWIPEESEGFNITRDGRLLWKPGIQARRDIKFIAAARDAVPALVATVRVWTSRAAAAESERDELAAMLERVLVACQGPDDLQANANGDACALLASITRKDGAA